MTRRRRRISIWLIGLGLIAAQGGLLAVLRHQAAAAGDPDANRLVSALSMAGYALIALTFVWLVAAYLAILRDARRTRRAIDELKAGKLSFPVASTLTEFAELATGLDQAADDIRRRHDLLNAQISQQRIIHQSMSAGMIALDLEQRVLSVNRAAEQLLRIKEVKVAGRYLREVLHEPELNRFVTETLRKEESSAAEITLHGHGKPTIHIVAERLRGSRDSIVGLLLLLQDVTRLRRLETMRSDFAANVSHELRTPITNIKGYVETLIDSGTTDAAQTSRFLEVIHRNADRLASIIEDLLSLAKLEEPTQASELVRTEIALRDIFEAVVANQEQAWQAKQISIAIDAPPDLTALLDQPLMEQAVGNLLSNAIKYSFPSSTIHLRGDRLDSDSLVISVEDHGAGIPPEHLSRLFERFYRVDKARSRELGGTGLGLAIVKHIAQVHGGHAEVESIVDKGSVFKIIVPIGTT